MSTWVSCYWFITDIGLPVTNLLPFPFSALTLLNGWQEGQPTCKSSPNVLFWRSFCCSSSSNSEKGWL